jgi:hypothetical protein
MYPLSISNGNALKTTVFKAFFMNIGYFWNDNSKMSNIMGLSFQK